MCISVIALLTCRLTRRSRRRSGMLGRGTEWELCLYYFNKVRFSKLETQAFKFKERH